MEKIDIIERKGKSSINLTKIPNKIIANNPNFNIPLNKRSFNSNILILNKNNSGLNKKKITNTKIIGKITQQLLNCGYSMECVKYCYEKYKFDSIDKAFNIIMKDTETGKYNHNFFSISTYEKLYGKIITDIEEKNRNHICFICKDIKKYHIDYKENDNDLENKDFTIKNNSYLSLLKNKNYINNSFSLLNQNPEKENLKLSNLKSRDSCKSCIPFIQININLINNIVKELESKQDLCLICYSNELKEENSLKMECGHKFCFDCYKYYIKDKIENGIVNIKCLMAGCINIIPDKIIKQFSTQDLYRKYIKFKKRNLYIENMKKGLIPCIHPDCEEWIKYKDGDDPNVTCKEGHSFCAKCKQKQHKGKRCKLYERKINKNSRIKPCPNCNYLIEKSTIENKIICPICYFTFCWLCLNKFSDYHYYFVNFTGCPCLRYADPKNSKILNNKIIQCLWFFLSFIFTLFTFAFIAVLYILFGASYDLIIFYDKKKNNVNNFDSGISIDLSDFSSNGQGYITNEINNTRINNSINHFFQQNSFEDKNENKSCKGYSIYFLLFFIGIILQPFFLVFKILQIMMECYKKYGCWFFYMTLLRQC